MPLLPTSPNKILTTPSPPLFWPSHERGMSLSLLLATVWDHLFWRGYCPRPHILSKRTTSQAAWPQHSPRVREHRPLGTTSPATAWCSDPFWEVQAVAPSVMLHSQIYDCPRSCSSSAGQPEAPVGVAAGPCRPWWLWALLWTSVQRRGSRAGWWISAAASGWGLPRIPAER